jgi:sugar lactone lactonase YvrE
MPTRDPARDSAPSPASGSRVQGVVARLRRVARRKPRRGRPQWGLASALLVLGGVLAVVGVRTGMAGALGQGVRMGAAVAADSVAVFGPKRFGNTAAGTQTHVEQFAVSAYPAARYVLRIENGAADGTARLDSARVVLNGAVVFTTAEIHAGTGTLSRAVTPLASNTLEVRTSGAAGRYLTATLLQQPDPTFDVFGPKRYQREPGTPEVVTDAFTLPAGAGAPYTLHLVNGNADGTDRVSSASVMLNGVEVVSSNEMTQSVGSITRAVTLQASNTVQVRMEAKPRRHMTLRITATDTVRPVLTISAPVAGLLTRDSAVAVSGSVQDRTAVQVSVNGLPASMSSGSFQVTVPLPQEGENTLLIRATDAAGNRTDSTRTVIRDTSPPVLSVSSPAEGLVTRAAEVVVTGSVQDRTRVTVQVNGTPLLGDSTGAFSGSMALAEGVNLLTITATDQAGNSSSVLRQVTRSTPDTIPPVLSVSEPLEGTSTPAERLWVRGRAHDNAGSVTLTINGTAVPVQADSSFAHEVSLVVGSNAITVTATDAAQNPSTLTRTVTRTTADTDLPPDPATVAPALDATVATSTYAASQFLYTGSSPIQTGVAPGTINPVRTAVIRGRVLTRDGSPLPGVKVSIKDHPELGETKSRADGRYDLVANGGGMLTLDFTKSGFLPAQRQVQAPWQDYVHAEEVALLPLDPEVTQVNLGTATEIQVARSTPQTDADGTRTATLFFKPGTTAEMVLPNGTRQALSTLNVRATEYTVGDNGPRAMPAPLPPTVAYTYAVELSVDEAIAAGASHVVFDRPVAFYVENFLEFPVGTPVPVGWYDFDKSAWVPEDNGKVIKILSTTGGVAEIDTNGDGQPESESTLAALGIDSAERQKLAQTYTAGTSLWRVQTTHFSTVDLNCGGTGPPDAEEPKEEPKKEDDKDEEKESCETSGSIIECQGQILGQRVGVSGTGFTLNYRSDRVPGRTLANTIKIPLSGESIPASLRRIDLKVNVAGRQFTDTFLALPNQSTVFNWDGLDAYGRQIQGLQRVTVQIDYVYQARYLTPPDIARSFGYTCETLHDGKLLCEPDSRVRGPARQEMSLSQKWTISVGPWDARALGLGAWALDVHHVFDPAGGLLYLGNGERRAASAMDPVVTTVAGNGTPGTSGDGGLATAAQIMLTASLTAAPDGSLYIADSSHRIRRVGADGSLYIADWRNNRIRKVDPSGIITTFAGNGVACSDTTSSCGDGGPATEAMFNEPNRVAVARDGTVYVADRMTYRVRRIGLDGIISTVAGNGTKGFSGDGGPATRAQLQTPNAIAIGPDGSLYIATPDWTSRIRRVSPTGVISTFAGGQSCRWIGNTYDCGDGGPATAASFEWPNGLTVAPDGTLYIADTQHHSVRKVTPDGVVSTVLGGRRCSDYWKEEDPTCGDKGPATAALLDTPLSASVGPDGSLYVTDYRNYRIRRVRTPIPGFSGADIAIASDRGRECA